MKKLLSIFALLMCMSITWAQNVAKIGSTEYATLQEALDDAHSQTGDITVELTANVTGYAIVRQKLDLNLTIEGNNDTIFGQIIVDGDSRYNGPDELIFQNINFVGETSDFYSTTSPYDAFISAPKPNTLPSPYTRGTDYNYCHKITISNCSFTSTSSALDVVAFKNTSGKNIIIQDCKGDNLHSLAQFTGTEGATITNDTITNSENFVNISGGSDDFSISNNFYTGTGYAVRLVGTSGAEANLSDNNFTSSGKVLMLGKNGNYNPSGHINVASGTYNGHISKETVATSTAAFVLTGGIYDEDSAIVASWCAPGYLPFFYSPGHWIVAQAYKVSFEPNGGSGDMYTVIVNADSVFKAPECTFTNATSAFTGWNSKDDGTGNSCNPGDVVTLTSDTTFYAQWGGVVYNVNKGIAYADLQTAADDVNAGDTVRLLDNISMTTTVNITTTFTLDLNGDTISGSAADVIVVDGGDLTIKDGGVDGLMRNTEATSDDVIWLKNDGAVTLNSGKISSLSYGMYIGSASSTATVTINGGTVDCQEVGLLVKDGDLTVNDGTVRSEKRGIYLATAAATATIEDGIIESENFGIIVMDGTATVNNGSVTAPIYPVFVKAGNFTANGGTLENNRTDDTYDAAVIKVDTAVSANITIAGADLIGNSNNKTHGIWDVMSKECNITMTSGTITTKGYCIVNNGSATTATSKWLIKGGTLTSTDHPAIFHSAPDSVIIGVDCTTGPTITGKESAIESRAGHLVIKGGELTATATGYACDPNGSGTTTTGAAVAIAQHTTNLPTTVDISCGTLNGEVSVSIANPQNNTTTNVEASITGGTFNGEVVATDDRIEDFISGGTYNDANVIAELNKKCAPGYAAFANGDGTSTVLPAYFFYYDKNHVTATGTMDTIIVKQSASVTDRTYTVLDCAFTCADSIFIAWNNKADGTGDTINVGDELVLNSDTTLYALWHKYYNISYNNNGGSGTISDTIKLEGVDFILSDGAAFSKPDSTLYRWNTAADETGTDWPLGGTYDVEASNTFYAVWRLTLDMTMDSTDVVCYGENNGTDTVKIIGGEEPFQLVLSGTALSENDTIKYIMDRTYIFENLKPGSYTVTLTDVLGKDTITGTFTIAQPDTLEITALTVPTNKPCPLMGVGSFDASVTAQGGNDPGNYTYTWGDDATDVNAAATEVPAKADDIDYTYTVSVTVTDVKACTATATATIEVSKVIVHVDSLHGNTTMKIDTIKQGIMQGCDTIIRDYGTPTFTFSDPAITEDILDTVYNDIPTNYPDSIFSLGYNPIIWTAVDTCGHEVTCEQIIYIYHYPCPSVDDGEGNTYNGVRVGCLCWTDRNLVSTKYSSNGNTIPNLMTYVSENFPNESENVTNFGYLYDWYAAADTVTNNIADIEAIYAAGKHVQGVCPNGWYLPTDEDFKTLESIDAKDLRSTDLWLEGGGTNATGFNAVPGGFYNCSTGRFEDAAGNAYYWSCHPVYDKATGAMIDYICEKIYNSKDYSRCNGFSVRCVLIYGE